MHPLPIILLTSFLTIAHKHKTCPLSSRSLEIVIHWANPSPNTTQPIYSKPHGKVSTYPLNITKSSFTFLHVPHVSPLKIPDPMINNYQNSILLTSKDEWTILQTQIKQNSSITSSIKGVIMYSTKLEDPSSSTTITSTSFPIWHVSMFTGNYFRMRVDKKEITRMEVYVACIPAYPVGGGLCLSPSKPSLVVDIIKKGRVQGILVDVTRVNSSGSMKLTENLVTNLRPSLGCGSAMYPNIDTSGIISVNQQTKLVRWEGRYVAFAVDEQKFMFLNPTYPVRDKQKLNVSFHGIQHVNQICFNVAVYWLKYVFEPTLENFLFHTRQKITISFQLGAGVSQKMVDASERRTFGEILIHVMKMYLKTKMEMIKFCDVEYNGKMVYEEFVLNVPKNSSSPRRLGTMDGHVSKHLDLTQKVDVSVRIVVRHEGHVEKVAKSIMNDSMKIVETIDWHLKRNFSSSAVVLNGKMNVKYATDLNANMAQTKQQRMSPTLLWIISGVGVCTCCVFCNVIIVIRRRNCQRNEPGGGRGDQLSVHSNTNTVQSEQHTLSPSSQEAQTSLHSFSKDYHWRGRILVPQNSSNPSPTPTREPTPPPMPEPTPSTIDDYFHKHDDDDTKRDSNSSLPVPSSRHTNSFSEDEKESVLRTPYEPATPSVDTMVTGDSSVYVDPYTFEVLTASEINPNRMVHPSKTSTSLTGIVYVNQSEVRMIEELAAVEATTVDDRDDPIDLPELNVSVPVSNTATATTVSGHAKGNDSFSSTASVHMEKSYTVKSKRRRLTSMMDGGMSDIPEMMDE